MSLTLQALQSGFRHLDNSYNHGNQSEVGKAIVSSGIRRNELYITSKYDALNGASVEDELEQTLAQLGVDYLDLYLVHQPKIAETHGIKEVWQRLETALQAGKVRSIGVSNYSVDDLKKLDAVATVKPSVNQIWHHVFNAGENQKLLTYCKEHDILVQAYGSLMPLKLLKGSKYIPVESVRSANKAGEKIASELSTASEQPVSLCQMILDWQNTNDIAVATRRSQLDEMLVVFEEDFPPLTSDQITEYESSVRQE